MSFDRFSRKILVVDDDDTIRALCTELLTEAGYVVETASCGVDALRRLRDSSFDLVITDVNMPELDGIGLYFVIQRDYPYLKDRFLFITGNIPIESEDTVDRLKEERIFLKKPFRLKELLGHVNRLTRIPLEEYFKQEGINRRKEERLPLLKECSISTHDEITTLTANIEDISRKSLRIKYKGQPLERGSKVNVYIKDLNLNSAGRVLWTKVVEKSVFIGLSLSECIPVGWFKKDLP